MNQAIKPTLKNNKMNFTQIYTVIDQQFDLESSMQGEVLLTDEQIINQFN